MLTKGANKYPSRFRMKQKPSSKTSKKTAATKKSKVVAREHDEQKLQPPAPVVPFVGDLSPEDEEAIIGRIKLSSDLRTAAESMTPHQARFLVDAYYQMQDSRIRTGNQVKATERAEEPHAVLDWVKNYNLQLEKQILAALDRFSKRHPMGIWARSNSGVGPVIAAALIAHIDITKAPTVGHIWRFAGLDPTTKWEKGQKRPWNAALKVVCWKLGQSFVKVSGDPEAYYGQQYLARKGYEMARNNRGGNVEAALAGAQKVAKSTEAYLWLAGHYPAGTYEAWSRLPQEKRAAYLESAKLPEPTGLPVLPPGQIQARATRWTAKLFLSHLHNEWYWHHYHKAPPLPYPIAHLGHAHYLPAPNSAHPDTSTSQAAGG